MVRSTRGTTKENERSLRSKGNVHKELASSSRASTKGKEKTRHKKQSRAAQESADEDMHEEGDASQQLQMAHTTSSRGNSVAMSSIPSTPSSMKPRVPSSKRKHMRTASEISSDNQASSQRRLEKEQRLQVVLANARQQSLSMSSPIHGAVSRGSPAAIPSALQIDASPSSDSDEEPSDSHGSSESDETSEDESSQSDPHSTSEGDDEVVELAHSNPKSAHRLISHGDKDLPESTRTLLNVSNADLEKRISHATLLLDAEPNDGEDSAEESLEGLELMKRSTKGAIAMKTVRTVLESYHSMLTA